MTKLREAALPALQVDELSVAFSRADGSAVQALDGVSLTVEQGEFICVLGRSGHGKTTLLNAIAGLNQPQSGSIQAMGQQISGPGVDRGVIFQRDAVFPWMRVEDNVGFGLRVAGRPRDEQRMVALAQLENVGLSHVAQAWPRELSGGMRARVAVASVFAMDPPILLADEPFGALDYVTRRQLQEVLLTLWQKTRKTIFFVTHDVDEALRLATRIIVVGNGRILVDMPTNLPVPRSDEQIASARGLELRHLLLHNLGLE